jgi:hypothetical protein
MALCKVSEGGVKEIFGIQKIGWTIFARRRPFDSENVSKAVDSDDVTKADIEQFGKKIDEMQENINALLKATKELVEALDGRTGWSLKQS